MRHISLAFAVLLISATAGAQQLVRDSSFNGNGLLTVSQNTLWPSFGDVVVTSDNKLVGVGSISDVNTASDWFMAAFDLGGQPDANFGTNGIVIESFGEWPDMLTGIAEDANGNLVVGGYAYDNVNLHSWDFVASRYFDNGTMDVSFGDNGISRADWVQYNDEAYGLALQSDGKIVLGGTPTGMGQGAFTYPAKGAARYNTDGSLDASFGSGGMVSTYLTPDNFDRASAMALQPDDKLLLGGITFMQNSGGFHMSVVRYTVDGELDTSFANGGSLLLDEGSVNHILLLNDGKIMVVARGTEPGGTAEGLVLIRLNSDGSFDNTFGNGGSVVHSFGLDAPQVCGAVADEQNRVLMCVTAGTATGIFTRVNTDGTADMTFGDNGLTYVDTATWKNTRGMKWQPDGKLLVYGQTTDGTNGVGMIRRFLYGQSTGILPEIAAAQRLEVYPNPSTGAIWASLHKPTETAVTARVYNTTGQLIVTKQFTSGSTRLQIPVPEHLSPGVYLLRIQTGEQAYWARIVRQ